MIRAFLFLSFLLITNVSCAQDTIFIKDNPTRISTEDKEIYFFSETDSDLPAVINKQFKTKKEVPLYYITGIVWVKFVIKNNSTIQRFVIHPSDGHLAGMYLYKPDSTGYVMTPAKRHHPEDGRDINNRIPAFFLDISPQETKTFYLKYYTSNEVANFNFIIEDYVSYTEYVELDYLIIGLYFGALLLIIAINLFYFISLRKWNFLIYAVYVFITLLVTLTIHGFAWLLIPNEDISYHVAFFIFRLWPDVFLIFTIRLITLKEYYPKFTKVCYGFIGYHSFIVPIFEFTNAFEVRTKWMGQWESINFVSGFILVFIAIVLSYKHNKYLFKYYLIAYSALLITIGGFSVSSISKSNWIVMEHLLKVGTLIEIITFSFAVSRNFKITQADLRKKKEDEQKLHEKVKQLEMDVRKAQMNPHFVFNCLNAIQDFIIKNDSASARRFLTSFAKLIRTTLNNSRRQNVTLEEEIEFLKLYLGLEQMRFNNKFDFRFNMQPDLNVSGTEVPAMILQPFVENAIRHGRIGSLDRQGILLVSFEVKNNTLICSINDNGIGYNQSAKNEYQPGNKQAHALDIINDRIKTIAEINKTNIRYTIQDKSEIMDGETGTLVMLFIPLNI
ncbi:MAG TPA: histidine kinase [Bacteroidia bacterium]|nr:histidine kinase [Bacteroidia bacterium]